MNRVFGWEHADYQRTIDRLGEENKRIKASLHRMKEFLSDVTELHWMLVKQHAPEQLKQTEELLEKLRLEMWSAWGK